MGELIELKGIEMKEVTKKDIADMNVQALSDVLLQSSFITIAALFSQAKSESARIEDLRKHVKKVETDLFSDEVFSNLSNEEKIGLYAMTSRGLASSLSFLNKIHDNISKGMEATSQLEARASVTTKSGGARKLLTKTEQTDKINMRKLLEAKIAEKIQKEGRKNVKSTKVNEGASARRAKRRAERRAKKEG
jgi:hypothetical protein